MLHKFWQLLQWKIFFKTCCKFLVHSITPLLFEIWFCGFSSFLDPRTLFKISVYSSRIFGWMCLEVFSWTVYVLLSDIANNDVQVTRMVVSTYQAASGAGAAAMEELELQTREVFQVLCFDLIYQPICGWMNDLFFIRYWKEKSPLVKSLSSRSTNLSYFFCSATLVRFRNHLSSSAQYCNSNKFHKSTVCL